MDWIVGFLRQRRQSSGDRGVGNGSINDSSLTRPKSPKQNSTSSEHLQLVQNPIKLLELKSRYDEHIVCAALSSDSRWLAYSTDSLIRIYTLNNVSFSLLWSWLLVFCI